MNRIFNAYAIAFSLVCIWMLSSLPGKQQAPGEISAPETIVVEGAGGRPASAPWTRTDPNLTRRTTAWKPKQLHGSN